MSMIPEYLNNIRSSDLLPLVRTYGPEHITKDGKFLQVILNKQTFPLRLTNVGSEEIPAYIGWLDTHPPDEHHIDVHPELPHATAEERAHRIATIMSFYHQDFNTIITPYSSKSIPSIEETVWIASHILQKDLHLIILPGGKDKEMVTRESVIPPIAYRNVTSPDVDKYIGIASEGYELLQRLHHDGGKEICIDDVFTTGGTDYGVQLTINRALLLPDTVRHPLVVVATESPYNLQYPAKVPPHVFSIINLPEFVGQLPAILQNG